MSQVLPPKKVDVRQVSKQGKKLYQNIFWGIHKRNEYTLSMLFEMQQFCLSYGSNSGLIFELNKEVAKIVVLYHVLKKSADAISFLKKLRNILKIMLSM